ncbi:MAG: outer membrane protein TolC [Myxococcota bacterium]|jgi:outer membrane protein TolC
MRFATRTQIQSLFALLALAAFAAPVYADDDAAVTYVDPVAEEGQAEEITEITLREAVDLAIENNLGVEIERHAPLIAQQDVSIAWSAYDPTLSASLAYTNDRQPVTNPNSPLNAVGDPKNAETAGTAGITGLVPLLGATLSLDYSASRNTTNTGFAAFSPQYDSGLAIALDIPLLKGLIWNSPWTQVKVTNLAHTSALENFRDILIGTVSDVEAAYWGLVADEEQLRVATKSLQTGLALLEQTKTQYEVGVKSKVEVIQAEAGVAARELDVLSADARFWNSQDRLINVVYGVRLTPGMAMRLVLTDKPSDFQDIDVEPQIATELAMQNRPELASLHLEIERQETLVRFQKNQRLPSLDLNLAYGTNGIRGKGNPVAFGGQPPNSGGAYGETHNDWFSDDGGRNYTVGGTFSIPLGNSGPRHSVSKARFELRRAKTRLIQLHQLIILEVRRDIRLLDASRKGIDASERQRVAAEEQLRAERIRLEHGESTPFDVLQKESDLVEAEVAKITALQLYRTSASDLDRAQGTILRTHNIVVGSVGGLRNGMERESFGVRDLLDPILP